MMIQSGIMRRNVSPPRIASWPLGAAGVCSGYCIPIDGKIVQLAKMCILLRQMYAVLALFWWIFDVKQENLLDPIRSYHILCLFWEPSRPQRVRFFIYFGELVQNPRKETRLPRWARTRRKVTSPMRPRNSWALWVEWHLEWWKLDVFFFWTRCDPWERSFLGFIYLLMYIYIYSIYRYHYFSSTKH